MKVRDRKSRESGSFSITPGREIHGELILAGARTSLKLHDTDFFDARAIRNLHGILHDRIKVSLIDCISPGTGTGTRGQERYHEARVFPHFVVYGERHLIPDQELLAEVEFVVDDATAIFYDFDAFGTLIKAEPFIEEIVRANNIQREISVGSNPIILYFTGKHEIVATETVFGKIAALHAPSFGFGGPKGVGIKNTIVVNIIFQELLTFHDAIKRIWILTQYLGLLAGRPQNMRSLSLRLKDDDDRPVILPVYWSMPPNRSRRLNARKPHPADMPLNPIRRSAEFCTVLRNWLERDESWRDARSRFFNCFAEQGNNSIDRLVAAANMFDILPSSALPRNVQLSNELKIAKSKGIDLFRRLPPSSERASVLSALGRMGKATLKQKIRHRVKVIADILRDRFPELERVTDEAVNCRNHYVHGSPARINYSENPDLVHFFVTTLEFVFAASDLIECGWDIGEWNKIPTSMTHPFGSYRIAYAEMLGLLRTLLPNRAAAKRPK
jgi:hypothetical protein